MDIVRLGGNVGAQAGIAFRKRRQTFKPTGIADVLETGGIKAAQKQVLKKSLLKILLRTHQLRLQKQDRFCMMPSNLWLSSRANLKSSKQVLGGRKYGK